MRLLILVCLAAQLVVHGCLCIAARAAFQTFTSLSSFTAATASLVPSLVNFDSSGLPTPILNGSSFQNITFSQSQNFLGSNLVLTDGTNTGTFVGPAQLPTTSGSMFLGNTVNGNLTAGRHNFTMQFNPPTQIAALGISVVVPGTGRGAGVVDPTGSEIRMSVNNGATFVQLGAVQQTLRAGQADEAQVYFLGLYNDSGLLGDVLLSTPGANLDAYQYRVDDLRLMAIPEPSSLAAVGLVGALAAVRRARSKRKASTAQ